MWSNHILWRLASYWLYNFIVLSTDSDAILLERDGGGGGGRGRGFLEVPMKPWILVELIPGFCSNMKQLGVYLFPLNGMVVHRRSFPRNLLRFPNNLPIPTYTTGWGEALWELSVLPRNTTQCPRPGLEPGPLAPGMSALTMRPPITPITLWVLYPSPVFLVRKSSDCKTNLHQKIQKGYTIWAESSQRIEKTSRRLSFE